MKRFRIILSVAFIAALFSKCNIDCIEGSGKQVTQTREVGEFSKIDVGGSVKLILKQGDRREVKIVADDNVQEHIRTRISGSKLEIDMEGNLCNSGPVTVYITNDRIEGLDLSGAVEVISDGLIKADDFDIDLSGSSKVDLQLNAASLKTESSGSSEIRLRGQAGTHDLDLSGSSEVNAFDFVVGRYKVSTSGASKVHINVLNTLDVESSGASNVEYKGNPSNVDNDNSGASTLKKVD